MYAYLFPGQGSQFVGMADTFASSSPNARVRMEEANDLLGFDIGRLMLQGPKEELGLTANTQPAILLHSVIACEALRQKTDLIPVAAAGHSLGEFTACWAAGVFSFGDAIRIVRRRGELMQSAVPAGEGAMAAIIGPAPDEVEALLVEFGAKVRPANFNSPQQTVIAGPAGDIDEAMVFLKGRGAKRAIKLDVSAPFHTDFMAPAREGLAVFMEDISFSDPIFPVIRNIDAGSSNNVDEVKDGLLRQVTGCVRWVDSMQAMIRIGIDRAIEIGPGSVLAGLVRRIDKSVTVLPCGGPNDIDGAIATIGG